MTRSVTAVFDGTALRPEEPLDLEPNTRYVITIQPLAAPCATGDAWDTLESLAGSLEAPADWAAEHDRHLSAEGRPEGQ